MSNISRKRIGELQRGVFKILIAPLSYSIEAERFPPRPSLHSSRAHARTPPGAHRGIHGYARAVPVTLACEPRTSARCFHRNLLSACETSTEDYAEYQFTGFHTVFGAGLDWRHLRRAGCHLPCSRRLRLWRSHRLRSQVAGFATLFSPDEQKFTYGSLDQAFDAELSDAQRLSKAEAELDDLTVIPLLQQMGRSYAFQNVRLEHFFPRQPHD